MDDAIEFLVGGGSVSGKAFDYLMQVKAAAIQSSGLARQHCPQQVVLLGAGMDTRALRLDLPAGLHWFEIDRAEVLRFKHKLLRVEKDHVAKRTVNVVTAGCCSSPLDPHMCSNVS